MTDRVHQIASNRRSTRAMIACDDVQSSERGRVGYAAVGRDAAEQRGRRVQCRLPLVAMQSGEGGELRVGCRWWRSRAARGEIECSVGCHWWRCRAGRRGERAVVAMQSRERGGAGRALVAMQSREREEGGGGDAEQGEEGGRWWRCRAGRGGGAVVAMQSSERVEGADPLE